jgi:hypothetical protein
MHGGRNFPKVKATFPVAKERVNVWISLNSENSGNTSCVVEPRVCKRCYRLTDARNYKPKYRINDIKAQSIVRETRIQHLHSLHPLARLFALDNSVAAFSVSTSVP